ncbi:MAG: SCO family protein [Deltaproteobacteria bacterium]|nr:SCO family protein [Deltaproteobacteria bacterium]
MKLRVFLFLLTAFFSAPLCAAEQTPVELEGVGIEEQLGKLLSTELSFFDEAGKEVWLKSYMDGQHPLILAFVYYECPNLCTFVLNALTDALKDLSWTPGKEFQAVMVSINPKETPELAAAKKASHLEALGKPTAASGWHFLTGEEIHIKALADQAGFHYIYDPVEEQYAHAATLIILTPDGRISRYLYGIQYPPRDVKLALLEATEGKIGNIIDRFMLFCYHYDPKGKKYALMATRLMKGGAAVTVLVILTFIFKLRRK